MALSLLYADATAEKFNDAACRHAGRQRRDLGRREPFASYDFVAGARGRYRIGIREKYIVLRAEAVELKKIDEIAGVERRLFEQFAGGCLMWRFVTANPAAGQSPSRPFSCHQKNAVVPNT